MHRTVTIRRRARPMPDTAFDESDEIRDRA
jgi:hypothetical protein